MSSLTLTANPKSTEKASLTSRRKTACKSKTFSKKTQFTAAVKRSKSALKTPSTKTLFTDRLIELSQATEKVSKSSNIPKGWKTEVLQRIYTTVSYKSFQQFQWVCNCFFSVSSQLIKASLKHNPKEVSRHTSLTWARPTRQCSIHSYGARWPHLCSK